MKLFFSTFALLVAAFFANAQINPLQINPNIKLPKDSIESAALISAVNNFLAAAQKPDEVNKLVFETEKIETLVLLNKINGIEKNTALKDDHFYRPYLTNIVSLNSNEYMVQISYIGVNKNTTFLRASFELIAHRINNGFLFSSSLLRNAKGWKTEKVGNTIFHYQTIINKAKAQEFDKLASVFDKKLKAINKVTEFYCCENIFEMQRLTGVQYTSDYNGRLHSVWSSTLGDTTIIILGDNNAEFNDFDPHDLWHERVSLVSLRNQINRPIDEGCAYLYGGSWGMSWQAIFKEFKEQVAGNKNTDWVKAKETPVYFKTKGFNNSADCIVNALLVQKIEKEQGFAGVWEFLNCGKAEKDNENYYQVLEKLTGITKANYNEKVWELINNYPQALPIEQDKL